MLFGLFSGHSIKDAERSLENLVRAAESHSALLQKARADRQAALKVISDELSHLEALAVKELP